MTVTSKWGRHVARIVKDLHKSEMHAIEKVFLKETDHLDDLSINGRVTLNLILK
jgi:hypothetical protein